MSKLRVVISKSPISHCEPQKRKTINFSQKVIKSINKKPKFFQTEARKTRRPYKKVDAYCPKKESGNYQSLHPKLVKTIGGKEKKKVCLRFCTLSNVKLIFV